MEKERNTDHKTKQIILLKLLNMKELFFILILFLIVIFPNIVLFIVNLHAKSNCSHASGVKAVADFSSE